MNIRRSLLLAAMATAACSSSEHGRTDEAVASARAADTAPDPIAGAPYLTIDQIEPAVENRRVAVHFTIHNTSKDTLRGYVSGEIDSPQVGVPSGSAAGDWPVFGLAPGDTMRGVLFIVAPRAVAQANVHLTFYRPGEGGGGEFYPPPIPMFDVTAQAPIAARYTYGLSHLHVHNVRVSGDGMDNDTFTLSGTYAGGSPDPRPSKLRADGSAPPPTDLSPGPLHLGMIASGDLDVSPTYHTKPFDVIPDSDKSHPGVYDPPNFGIFGVNYSGNDYELLRNGLDTTSHVVAAAMTAAFPAYSALWAGLDALTQQINTLATDCNGFVAINAEQGMTGPELELATRSGPLTHVVSLNGDVLGGQVDSRYESPAGCGHAPWYELTLGYERLPAGDVFEPVYPIVVVKPGQSTLVSVSDFRDDSKQLGWDDYGSQRQYPADWNILHPTAVNWHLEGNFRNSKIGDDGTFLPDPALLPSDEVRIVGDFAGFRTVAYVDVEADSVPGGCHKNPSGQCVRNLERGYKSGVGYAYSADDRALRANGFTVEQPSAFYLQTTAGPLSTPVYRCASPTGETFPSADAACEGRGATQDTIGFAAATPRFGTSPLYLARTTKGSLLTTDANEAASGSAKLLVGYAWQQPVVDAPMDAVVKTVAPQYRAGQLVGVHYAQLPQDVHGWIAIAPDGSPQTTYGSWATLTPATPTGDVSLLGPVAPGTYRVRLFMNNDSAVYAESAPFTVVSTAKITVDVTAVPLGGSVTAKLSGLPGNPHDWVAVARAGGSPSERFAGQEVSTTDGQVTLTTPRLGETYVVRAYANGGLDVVAESAPFTAGDHSATAPRVTPDATHYKPGAPIVVSYANMPVNTGAWITVAPEGSNRTAYLSWQFTAKDTANGQMTLTAPTDPGTYRVRGYYNNGLDLSAQSAPIVVDAH